MSQVSPVSQIHSIKKSAAMTPHDAVVYAIGDIQGCDQTLEKLLDQIFSLHQKSSPIHLWFAGDLINRGPRSLATLRRLYQLNQEMNLRIVLGNHDLHTLKVAAGVGKNYPDDTIADILTAPDRDTLLNWLRHQPLVVQTTYQGQDYLMLHAGVYPQWTVEDTLTFAQEIEQSIQSESWVDFMRDLYGNTPMAWDPNLKGMERARCIVNALTRSRFCHLDKSLDFSSKGNVAPNGSLPWFDHPDRQTQHHTVVFGHWSAMGLVLRPNLVGLDTGCVWGGKLTAVRLHDRFVIQLDNAE
jgi:bis(5'-nucleosyl)-tetraphosphatase (symmetrical)